MSHPPPAPPPSNRRKHPRYEILASVEVQGADGTMLILPARDLSLGGIYLSSDGNDLSMLAQGSVVELLVFDGKNEEVQAVRARAMVIREDPQGLAFRWEPGQGIEPTLRALLAHLVRR